MRRYSNKGVIAAIIAVVLAVVLVLVCGIGSSWFTNGDFSTWFNRWGKGNEELEQGNEEGGVVIGEVEENGISLMSAKIASADYAEYGVSPLAETAYALTATITPSDASNKAVSWSAAWKNSSSAWANGKSVSDYVSISSNGLTATVECLQAFGEQIIVTVKSTSNSSASATCTVDYSQKLTSMSNSIVGSDAGVWQSVQVNEELGDGHNYFVNPQFNFLFINSVQTSAHTISDDYTKSVTFTPDSNFLDLCPSADGQSVTYTDDEIFDEMYGAGNFVYARTFLNELLGDSVWGTSEFYNACVTSYTSAIPVFTATITVEGEYSTLSESYDFYINPTYVTVNVTGVSLDKGSIVF